MTKPLNTPTGRTVRLRLILILLIDGLLAYASYLLQVTGRPEFSIALVTVIATLTLSFLVEQQLRQEPLDTFISEIHNAVVGNNLDKSISDLHRTLLGHNMEPKVSDIHRALIENKAWSDVVVNCADAAGRGTLLRIFDEIKMENKGRAICYYTWSGNYQDVTDYRPYFEKERQLLLDRKKSDPATEVWIGRIISVGKGMVTQSDYELHKNIMRRASLEEVYDSVLDRVPPFFDYAYAAEYDKLGKDTHRAVVVFLNSERKPHTLALFFDGRVNQSNSDQAREIGRLLKVRFDTIKAEQA